MLNLIINALISIQKSSLSVNHKLNSKGVELIALVSKRHLHPIIIKTFNKLLKRIKLSMVTTLLQCTTVLKL
jgi:hypothetical protein